MYNDSGPVGRVAAGCRRYSGGTVYRVIPFQPHRLYIQPAARHVANTTCADEWYDPIYGTKCSGVDPTPSSPTGGLAPWNDADTNVPLPAPTGQAG